VVTKAEVLGVSSTELYVPFIWVLTVLHISILLGAKITAHMARNHAGKRACAGSGEINAEEGEGPVWTERPRRLGSEALSNLMTTTWGLKIWGDLPRFDGCIVRKKLGHYAVE
jgi:hypothetical protein